MGHLIDDLLTYARLGRTGVRHEPVSLTDLMDEIRRNLQNHLTKMHATLNIMENLPIVIGDQTLLNQVFTNLLENAFKYHRPEVPPQVSLTYYIQDKYVVVKVSDNGIGIPLEYQDKILKQEGLSREQWNSNPGNLWRPEARGVAANDILNPNGPFPGEELQTALKNLILEFGKTPGYENLAKAAPSIFYYHEADDGGDPRTYQDFTLSPLSWALIYLDGLEANLEMIKVSVSLN